MANDTATSTAVGKWLIAQGAGKYAAAFFAKGQKDIVALTPDVIKEIVTDNSALADKLAEAIDMLMNGTTGDGGSGTTGGGGGTTTGGGRGGTSGGGGGSRPIIPEIPGGTAVDLTLQRIAIDNVPEFSIPGALSVNASNAIEVNPSNITKEDWMILARTWDITRAYTNELDTRHNPEKASKVALDWVVPTADYFSPVATGTVSSEVVYSDGTASFVKAGFDKESASIGCDFAAASFEREHEERAAQSSYHKQLHMIGRWYYPMVTLYMKNCTKVADRFKDAILTALNCAGLQDLLAKDALKLSRSEIETLLKVFKDYGTAVPEAVTLVESWSSTMCKIVRAQSARRKQRVRSGQRLPPNTIKPKERRASRSEPAKRAS